ncbi:MAG: type II toxin-antitoxin system VapC family toxin [Proteobacteria bacterium]|nr:type II toxin-antitoxin system VapC family toxin [Pseudomonadota bacterium]
MIVVDTNVVAYLLIEGDRTADARALKRADPDWRSEPFLLVEFSNLLATQVRGKALSVADAAALLTLAAQQVTGWAEVPHAEALAVALRWKLSAYDARFIACAQRLEVPLVTEDARLRAAAPGHTVSIAEAVALAAR